MAEEKKEAVAETAAVATEATAETQAEAPAKKAPKNLMCWYLDFIFNYF